MASNPIPKNNDMLLALAEDMADGLDTHGVSAGVKQIDVATMRASIANARAKENLYSTCKAATAVAEANVVSQDELSAAFILAASNVLKIALGTRWNKAWEPTGFETNTTQVPSSQGKRFTLLSSLKAYFTANPGKEAANLGVSAALADARFTALSQARDNAHEKMNEQKACKEARDIAFDALKQLVRVVIAALSYVLGADDSRWESFGLSRPSDPDTPESASAVVLTVIGSGSVHLTFKRGKRADRHRLFARLLPEETEFTQRALLHDLSYTFTDLPSGKTLEVKIIAANESGEAAPTEAVSVVVG